MGHPVEVTYDGESHVVPSGRRLGLVDLEFVLGRARAATWVRGFVNIFLIAPLACLGIWEAAEQLWNILQNLLPKSPPVMVEECQLPTEKLNRRSMAFAPAGLEIGHSILHSPHRDGAILQHQSCKLISIFCHKST